jgi:hypothetical protein
MQKKGNFVFLCLVCAQSTVCVLSYEDIKQVLSPTLKEQQSITVHAPTNASLRVKGTIGELSRVVPHNAFPKKLFAE